VNLRSSNRAMLRINDRSAHDGVIALGLDGNGGREKAG
jgi:hypothetical protein